LKIAKRLLRVLGTTKESFLNEKKISLSRSELFDFKQFLGNFGFSEEMFQMPSSEIDALEFFHQPE